MTVREIVLFKLRISSTFTKEKPNAFRIWNTRLLGGIEDNQIFQKWGDFRSQ